MSEVQRIGIYLDLFGAGKAQTDLKAVGSGLNALGPASQAGARAATQQLGTMQVSAAQTAAALRQVPAQFTDIVVSLQAGQQPLTVLLQQGGQLKDMFGGVGAAARAMLGYIAGLATATNAVIGGLVALGVGYYAGRREMEEFNKVLLMTGNQSGTSVQQLMNIASAMDDVAGITQGKAASALVVFASSAGAAADRLQRYTTTAIEWERETGRTIEETAKNFKKLAEDPVRGLLELNKQMNFLTAATFEQVKALQEAGKQTDAARVAQDAYEAALASAVPGITANLSYVERGWRAIKGAISEAVDEVKNFGRPSTAATRLAAITVEMAKLQKEGVQYDSGASMDSLSIPEKRLATLKAEEIQLQKNLVADRNATNAKNAARDQENALIDLSAEASRYYDKETKKRLELAAAHEKYDVAAKTSAKAQRELAILLAGIEEKYKDKGAGSGAASIQSADRRLDLSELQNAMRQEQAMLGQQQQQLELARSAGLISLEDYYRQKRGLIQKNAGLDEAGTQQQIDRLEQEKTKGADALNVQKQIVDLRGKLAVRQIQTQNELAAVDQQAAQAARQHAASIQQLGTAYEAYVTQLQRRADLEVEGQSMGDRRRGHVQGLNSIRENYQAQLTQLDDQKGMAPVWTPENEEYYKAKRASLVRQLADEERIYNDTYDRISESQSNWITGAMRATENYLDSTRDVAGQTQNLWMTAFQGAEGVLRNFVKTGKVEVKDLFSTIVSEFVVMQGRLMMGNALGGSGGGLLGFLGGMLGAKSSAASTVTGTATGSGVMSALQDLGVFAKGDVFTNSPSLSQYSNQIHSSPKLFAFAKGAGVFGEAGPEAIMPLTRGPDGNLGVRATGGAGRTVVPSVNVQFEVNNYSGAQVRHREETGSMPDGSVFKRFILDVVGESFDSGSGAPYTSAKRRFGLEG